MVKESRLWRRPQRRKPACSRLSQESIRRSCAGRCCGTTQQPGSRHHVDECRANLFPLACLQSAIRIDPELPIRQAFARQRQKLGHVGDIGNARRVDVVDTGSDLIRIFVALRLQLRGASAWTWIAAPNSLLAPDQLTRRTTMRQACTRRVQSSRRYKEIFMSLSEEGEARSSSPARSRPYPPGSPATGQ